MDCNCDFKQMMDLNGMADGVGSKTPGGPNIGSEDVLAPQNVTEKGMGSHDGVRSSEARDEKASSAQTPPITDCEATVVTAQEGASLNVRDPYFDESRHMGRHNAGRTTDIGNDS